MSSMIKKKSQQFVIRPSPCFLWAINQQIFSEALGDFYLLSDYLTLYTLVYLVNIVLGPKFAFSKSKFSAPNHVHN
jgi:hypothetical protein